MSRNRSLAPGSWVAIVLVTLAPAAACADDFLLDSSLLVREGYTSNLYFTPQDEVGSWVTKVSPGLDLSGKTERLDAGIGGNLTWWWYSAESDLNALDYDTWGRVAFLFTPVFRASATWDYRKESSPDRFFEETGLVQGFSVDYRQDYKISAGYDLSEKASATLSYEYEETDYPDLPQSDSSTQSANLGVTYNLKRFSEGTKGRANLGFSNGIYEGQTTRNYTFTVGVSRAVHELWSVVVDVGGRYTRTEFDVPGGTREDSSTGWVGDVSVVYTGERLNVNFTFSSNVEPSYGSGGAVIRTSGILGLSRQFLNDISGNLSVGYYWNKSVAGQFSTQAIDEQSAQLTPGLRWKATKRIVVDAVYKFYWLRNEVTAETSLQNSIYASATLSYPFFDK